MSIDGCVFVQRGHWLSGCSRSSRPEHVWHQSHFWRSLDQRVGQSCVHNRFTGEPPSRTSPMSGLLGFQKNARHHPESHEEPGETALSLSFTH